MKLAVVVIICTINMANFEELEKLVYQCVCFVVAFVKMFREKMVLSPRSLTKMTDILQTILISDIYIYIYISLPTFWGLYCMSDHVYMHVRKPKAVMSRKPM